MSKKGNIKTLADEYPEIAKQWHPTKNGDLTPRDVTSGSSKKVWWLCSKFENGICDSTDCGTIHEWQTTVCARTINNCPTGCPFCSNKGKVICKCKTLAYLFPDLSKEWHPTKNNNLTPNDVSAGSNSKVWWLCSNYINGVCDKEGCQTIHEWQINVCNRTSNSPTGCPFCSNTGKVICKCKSLAYVFPNLIREWHPTKNGILTPNDVSVQGHDQVWWLCGNYINGLCDKEGFQTIHEWKTRVSDRTRPKSPSGCPFCASHVRHICKSKSLAYLFPEIANEILYVDPSTVFPYSNKEHWWRCKDRPICLICGTKHEWKAKVSNRTIRGDKCPYCSKNGESCCKCKSLGYLYPEIANEIKDKTLDTFKIRIASNKIITWVCSRFIDGQCNECGTFHVWDTDIYHRCIKGHGCPYCSDSHEMVCKCKSFGWKFPELINEFYDKTLDPFKFRISSGKVIEWVCSKVPGGKCQICNTQHIWSTRIIERSNGLGCPWCSSSATRKYLCRCKTLAFYPNLLNEIVTDSDFFTISVYSLDIFQWRCTKGHTWEMSVKQRVSHKAGCPICRSLGYNHPHLVEEIADKTLDAFQIMQSSNKKIDWICQKCGNIWSAQINNRTSNKRGCPTCCINKAEKQLQELCEMSTYIRNFEKKRIKCYDESTQKYRNLEPDCMIELVNGKRAGIELDGRQHFESVDYFGSTPTDLQDQISRDRAKNKTLWQQGYSILRISYLEYDKIEEHFLAFIETLMENDDPKQQLFVTSNHDLYSQMSLDMII